jgi:hypothetical protein
MRLISLTCEMLLFLAVPIFRRAIFGSDLIAIPFIFRLSYFLGVRLLFLACLYLAVLFLAGGGAILLVPMSSWELVWIEQVEAFQCDTWQPFQPYLIRKTLGTFLEYIWQFAKIEFS